MVGMLELRGTSYIKTMMDSVMLVFISNGIPLLKHGKHLVEKLNVNTFSFSYYIWWREIINLGVNPEAKL